ncbi:MAG: transcription elongation factor GreA [Candidatus Dojkabacteria bacterium]|nr:MAG: transcription elongation factor GreA [Candidatus Dojkabacteria bacterium]
MPRKNTKQQSEDIIEMTQEAYDELKRELEERETVIRREIASEIAKARELGDLSENFPYQSAMEKKELNENRITDIKEMLRKAQIVTTSSNSNVVRVGNTVEIENIDTKQKRTITLVGAEETLSASPEEGKISIDSPVGKALNNAKVGDVVTVELPNREVKYKVLRLIQK